MQTPFSSFQQASRNDTSHGALRRTGGYLMSFTSRVISRLMHLPPAQTHDIVITRDIQIPMPDGVALLADH
jgi:predicted acyl esterase